MGTDFSLSPLRHAPRVETRKIPDFMGTDFSLSPLRHAPHVQTRKTPVVATELEETEWWSGNLTKTNSPHTRIARQ